MGYSTTWKPTHDFHQIVAPYIPNLIKVTAMEPLIIYYEKRHFQRIKWQWYDWLHHHFPQKYKLRFRKGPGREEITLMISLSQDKVASRLPTPEREYQEFEDNRRNPFDYLDD